LKLAFSAHRRLVGYTSRGLWLGPKVSLLVFPESKSDSSEAAINV
jgi:hypothetical protein